MYRAVAVLARRNGVAYDDAEAVTAIAAGVEIEFKTDPERGQMVFLNGEDVTDAIRTPEATRGSSAVAVHPGVRAEMVRRQKEMGRKGGLVAEGRDTTSVVFTDADLKVYLDADLKARAYRRYLEATQRGEETTPEQQEKLLEARDQNDKGRAESPLIEVPDAVRVDTTEMTIKQQVDKIIEVAREKFART
jgi:cytidylate kinase